MYNEDGDWYGRDCQGFFDCVFFILLKGVLDFSSGYNVRDIVLVLLLKYELFVVLFLIFGKLLFGDIVG